MARGATISDSSAVGWLVLVAGPLLALATFLIARGRRSTKWAWGAAAVVGLLWFVITAEWLPPAWETYWEAHSLAAGVITSLLIIAAGWVFVTDHLAKERHAALLATWRHWIETQCVFAEAMVEQGRPSPTDSVLAQRIMAADISARLQVQQQWIAALFITTSLRDDAQGSELITGLGSLRDAGTFATRAFAQLELLLSCVSEDHLSAGSIKELWGKPMGALSALLASLEALGGSVGAAQWKTSERAGHGPTHPNVVHVQDLKVKSKPWSGNSDTGSEV